MLPDFFGDERHDRVQEPEDRVEAEEEHRLGLRPCGGIGEPGLAEFEIRAAKLVPGEGVEDAGRLGEAIFVDRLRCIAGDARQPAGQPAIFERCGARAERPRLEAFEIHEHEAGGVPELVGEIPARLEPLGEGRPARQGQVVRLRRPLRPKCPFALGALDARKHPVLHGLLDPGLAVGALKLDRHPHVLRLGGHAHHAESQRVGPEGLDHVHRIDAVSLALAHRLAVAVENLGVDRDVAKRNLSGVEDSHDHHPGDPQRDDVAARDERARGIEARELGRGGGPAERGVRPER